MQMIDVLKRLAELDAANPTVAGASMTNEQTLVTMSNVESDRPLNESIAECGEMGMIGSQPQHTPASFSVSASSGPELSGILKDIMSLAGVKPVSQEPAMMRHMSPEFSPAHVAEPDMAKSISIIDQIEGDEGDEEMAAEAQADRIYTNSPEEEIEAHDFGDKQVTPRQNEPTKKNGGGNPYVPTHEGFEQIANRLLQDYREFVNESQKKR